MFTHGIAVSAVAATALLLPGVPLNQGNDGSVAARYKDVVASTEAMAKNEASNLHFETIVGDGGDKATAPPRWRHLRLPETRIPDRPYRLRHARIEQT